MLSHVRSHSILLSYICFNEAGYLHLFSTIPAPCSSNSFLLTHI